MKDGVLYFILANMVVAVALAFRASFLASKFAIYVRDHHPEKGKAFGCSRDSWFNSFDFVKALYRRHEIDNDQECFRLKRRARNALTWALLAVLPMSVFMILILIMSILFRS